MADKNIGLLVAKLNRAIEKGVDLFNDYKQLSKEFQNLKKILMNNTELKKELDNLKEKYEEKVKNATSTPATLKSLKNKYDEELKLIIKKKQLSEKKLVSADKKFLKEKKKITDRKKIILKNILDIGNKIRSSMKNKEEFKKFIDRIQKRKYEVLDDKKISFDTLMHHLSSGEISDEVAKTTKQIDELMTIGNIANRKKRMEIGILKKEIEKLSNYYEKTNKLSKESVKKDITNLVKSLNGITNAKKKEEVTTKIDRLSRSLTNEMTERQRKIKFDIQIKRQELKELEKSL